MQTYDKITANGINSIEQLFEAMEAAAKDEDGGGELEFRFIEWLEAIKKLKLESVPIQSTVNVDWHKFDPDTLICGEYVRVIEHVPSRELVVATTCPVMQVFASRKPGERWELKVSSQEMARLVLGVCDAADAFERQWHVERTPKSQPPSPWRWGISRFNRLQLESRGREGIELPRDTAERDAYLALAKQFDAIASGDTKRNPNAKNAK